MMKYFHFVSLVFSISSFAFSQTLVDAELILSLSIEEVNSEFELGTDGFPGALYDLDYYKITYETPDAKGLLDTASGVIVLPVSEEPFPMLAYHHGTTDRGFAPSDLSSGITFSSMFASQGYIAVVPDYLGLGEARGFHPYVHAATLASASLDMLFAARDFAMQDTILVKDELFISGFSQGGQAGAALHRLLQMEYPEEFNVVASALIAGPYSISGVMVDAMASEEDYVAGIAFLPYTILGLNEVYGFYEDLSEIFKPSYIPAILEFYEGTIELEEMLDSLATQLQIETETLAPKFMLTDSIQLLIETRQPADHPLLEIFHEQNTYEWVPLVPTRLYYCEPDEQTPFENSIFAEAQMNDLGAEDVQAIHTDSTLEHVDCAFYSIPLALDFFEGVQLTTDIQVTLQEGLEINTIPNPVQESVEIRFSQPLKQMLTFEVVHINGQLLDQHTIEPGSTSFQLSLSFYAEGIYFLKWKGGDNFLQTHKIVVRR